MIRQVDGTKIAIFIYEPIPRNVKVSLRCDVPYNVFEIANALGGGGHVLASGVIIKNKPIEEVKKMVLELAREQIDRFENWFRKLNLFLIKVIKYFKKIKKVVK